MLNCRVWPNGEFSIWEEKKTLKVEPPPESPDFLGLSLLANSHRIALGLSEPVPEKAPRGQKGITRLGARTVRNAAFLLQEKYGCDRLGFYTVTLPRVDDSAEYNAGREWAEIVRIFLQSVTRLLKAAGLPPSYVGCTEIQESRYARYGGLPLHLHFVCVGKIRGRKQWIISSDQWRALWRRAVVARCPEFSEVSFKASVDTSVVKKSAEGYLGKYMSKGAAMLSALLAEDPGIAEFLPKSWWCCSLTLKRAIGRRIAGGLSSARSLIRDVRGGDTRVAHAREIKIRMPDGNEVPVAVVGRLSPEGRRKYCHQWHITI